MTFIAFEGGNGVGKTTQVKMLTEAMERNGLSIISTKEPYRDYVYRDVDPMCRMFLQMSARWEHLQEVIWPNIRGKIIVTDRYIDSTYVYQGIMGGVPLIYIDEVVQMIEAPSPDITFILHDDSDLGAAYLKVRRHNPNRKYIVIDSSRDAQEVHKMILFYLRKDCNIHLEH